ncbi:hypothetical protein HNR23_003588 [Nocardiopsis mwathae]|uniref:Uncharacterized protein n=1 Tax=Nocardiopsis mwathae TaxID=1472723 RepID=A0A7W9YJW9_9ACTN|nr:hypothetical protein [Nocardiopsis mwathae]MBB6173528.1 hypothetical protein [Nocardiopsis mwathae]
MTGTSGGPTKAVVITVSRVLAMLLVAAALLLGAPLQSAAAAGSIPASLIPAGRAVAMPGPDAEEAQPRTCRVAGTASATAASTSAGGTHTAEHPRHDTEVVAPAMPVWKGDHRPALRDMPDVYAPGTPQLPDIGEAWGRAPLPSSARMPDHADTCSLPLGRAPPLSARA